MSLGWLFNNVAGALLLPPLNLILLGLLGLALRRRWPRLGPGLCVAALALLAVLSSKAGARLLVTPLERLSAPLTAPLAAQRGSGAQ
ncbi:YdcF family protein, partial [Undibacterium arcticum]